MKQLLIIITILISVLIVKAQSYSPFVKDSNVEEFISWEITNSQNDLHNKKKVKYINTQIADWFGIPMVTMDSTKAKKLINDIIYNNCKEFLSKEDIVFIENHFMQIISTLSSKGVLVKWKTKFNNAKMTEKLDKNHYYNYSVPLFSQDGKWVLLQKEFHGGRYNSFECIYLYNKTSSESEWTLIKEFHCKYW